MISDPLEGPRLKIERANAHIQELIMLVEDFWKLDVYELFKEVDSSGQNDLLKARMKLSPPGQIAVIAGEIIYGLRSAFDHTACALAVQNGASKISDTYFPSGRSQEHFESARIQEKIKRLSPDATAMIHSLKPYKGGNDLLYALHAINIVDKHQTLIPLATGTFATSGQFSIRPGIGRSTISAPSNWQPADKEILILSVPHGSQINANVEIISDIAFRNVEIVEGQSLIATLQQFSDLTSRIVKIVEDRFFRG